MPADTLYVIGNGFDIKHGIRSNYADFCSWLKCENQTLFRKLHLTYKITGPKWWNQFENNLAEIPLDAILIRSYEEAYVMEIWDVEASQKVGVVNDLVPEVGYDISRLMMDLQCAFWEFIRCLDVKFAKPAVIFSDRDALFLNFNYTDILERVYHIDPSRVLHIHGDVNDVSADLVFGHGRSYEEIYSKLSLDAKIVSQTFSGENGDIEDTISDASRQLLKARKDTDEIIRSNASFFDSLSSVNEIRTMGFSFSDVDLPYIDRIANTVDSDTFWHFGYHTHGDMLRMKFFANKHCLQRIDFHNF